MFRHLLAWMMLMLAALACNLGAAADDTPTAPPASATPIALPATATGRPVATLAPTTAATAGCSPRADWPVYTVRAGDTLGSLAQRTGSTITELSRANCLSNPDTLAVGQALRVPRAPVAVIPATVTPGAVEDCPPVGSDNPVPPPAISPYVSFEAYCYVVQPGTTVTVAWPGATTDFVEVTFYRNNGALPRPDVIGVDTNPADGASIQWQVPTEMQPSVLYVISAGPEPHSSVTSHLIGVRLAR